jgi:hypothetical protein
MFDDYFEELKADLRSVGVARGFTPEEIDRTLTRFEEVRSKYADDPTRLVSDTIRSPWPTVTVCRLIYGMTWRLLSTDGPCFFLTSDNPAFFFRGFGLGTREAELSFPLSSDLLLHGSMQAGTDGQRLPLRQWIVKEMNRRTASKATRYLFYRESQNWVAELCYKNPEHHQLNLIKW